MMMAGMNTMQGRAKQVKLKARGGRKRKARPVSITPQPWEAGPAMAANLVIEPVGELRIDLDHGKHKFVGQQGLKRARRQAWIEIYHAKGMLTDRQYAIADALAKAAAGQTSTDPIAALRIDVSGGGDPQAARIDTRRSYFRMMRMIPEDCRPVIERVVIEDRALPSTGGSVTAAYLKKLCSALNALADIFDLS